MIRLASEKGNTMVWFKTFVISIPHIHYMEAIFHEDRPEYEALLDKKGNIVGFKEK